MREKKKSFQLILISTGTVLKFHSFLVFCNKNRAVKTAAMCSSNNVHGLARILRNESLKFSPLIGLLCTSAPNIFANFRKFPDESSETNIAKELFHQREDSSGRRYGPVTVSNSRSNAISWLSPNDLGVIVGIAVSLRTVKVRKT
jgi:hypothetical protein